MTELKTLKDLTDLVFKRYTAGYVPSKAMKFQADLIKELKAEAIKWVKEIQKDRTIGVQLFTDGKKRKGNPIGTAYYGDEERKIINQEKIDFIMEFFNITEEDLK